jgi:hypothetical protein
MSEIDTAMLRMAKRRLSDGAELSEEDIRMLVEDQRRLRANVEKGLKREREDSSATIAEAMKIINANAPPKPKLKRNF